MNPESEADRRAYRLLRAIFEKTKGRGRAVRDVTELGTGLTAQQAQAAWRGLIEAQLIERFSQDYAARLSVKGLEFLETGTPLPEPSPAQPALPRKVLIVRGPDTGAREAVGRMVEGLGLQAVLVREPAGDSPADIGFVVVLMTPEDLGSVTGLMELGFYIGRVGRGRVCAMAVGGSGLPSDLGGVALVSLDADGEWQAALRVVLGAAGYEVA